VLAPPNGTTQGQGVVIVLDTHSHSTLPRGQVRRLRPQERLRRSITRSRAVALHASGFELRPTPVEVEAQLFGKAFPFHDDLDSFDTFAHASVGRLSTVALGVSHVMERCQDIGIGSPAL
jgi:hypothetical protein